MASHRLAAASMEELSIISLSHVSTQRPRLAPYAQPMVHTLAGTIGVDPTQISVKATTTDGLGFIGTEMGIAAYAICLCGRRSPAGEAESPQ